MGEQINKEFEKYQLDLKNRSKKIKFVTTFNPSSELDDAVNDLKNKEIVL